MVERQGCILRLHASYVPSRSIREAEPFSVSLFCVGERGHVRLGCKVSWVPVPNSDYAKGGDEIAGWTSVRDSEAIAKKTIKVACTTGIDVCQEGTELTLKRAGEADKAPYTINNAEQPTRPGLTEEGSEWRRDPAAKEVAPQV